MFANTIFSAMLSFLLIHEEESRRFKIRTPRTAIFKYGYEKNQTKVTLRARNIFESHWWCRPLLYRLQNFCVTGSLIEN